jgi:MOSC domain-containing protein YiiM
MKIILLNVALPSTQRYEGQEGPYGRSKKAGAARDVALRPFDGDGQADWVNHGGLEKAICVCPFDHYAHWRRVLGRELEPGTFRECDVFRAGGAVAQISQPRMPCSKLAGKNGEKLLTRWVAQTGYTGFYVRVLSEGSVSAGATFERVAQDPGRSSIAAVNDIVYERSQDLALIERLPGYQSSPPTDARCSRGAPRACCGEYPTDGER